ncbi:hypothetical protein LOK49_LG13G01681 [Camellia lanceoleosa]|uniref:Uncharacterized protein n=1 Tax=Camellia lanceoleosa TaxID=1840588 RepID=A0ACC0FNS0_9ERIC|nr:hypothetical protein LOK49_LG13G01681 [Camellia lanceoleosa]
MAEPYNPTTLQARPSKEKKMGVWSSSLAEEGRRHSLFSTSPSVRDHGGLSNDDDDDDERDPKILWTRDLKLWSMEFEDEAIDIDWLIFD